jgi:hypothetical protein
MDGFEYLTALVSVVAGLGLTRALSGFAKVIHTENKTALSGVHIAWTLSIIRYDLRVPFAVVNIGIGHVAAWIKPTKSG